MTNDTNKNRELGGYLAGITYGKQIKPIFALIHGLDGVGKSTWASQAPEPVFVGTENGSEQLDVARLPQPDKLGIFLNQLTGLQNQEHPFKTVVIDSIDWLEPLVWRQVCAEGPVNTIEDFGGGYGKGYVRALEIWRGTLQQLKTLANRFHVVLIAHSKIKKFEDPQLPSSYDRYSLAVHDSAAAAVRQMVDCVLFASFKERVRQVSKSVGKGLGEGERALYTEHRPAFDAKNRFNLPFELPLQWRPFAECVKEFYFGKPVQPAAIAGGADGQALPATASAESAPFQQEPKPEPAEIS